MICINTLNGIILLIIIIGMTTIYNYYNLRLTNTKSQVIYINNEKDIIHKRDQDALYNDFTPPERRVPYYEYPTNSVKNQINFPSRGYPDEYSLIGNIYRDETETIYELFGRQKYPGSMQYEYYVIGSDNKNFKVKIPIKVYGDKELENDQIINIPGTNSNKGSFKVKLFNYDTPRYIV
jgi:hypothetical protein